MWKPAWKLAWKDLYLQKNKLLWLMLTAVFMISILVSTNNIGFLPVIFIFAFILTYSFTIQTCFYEDKNNSLSFVRALPVSTSQIVTGKFLALAIITAGALLIGIAALLILQLATASGPDWLINGVYIVFAGLMNLSFNCLVVFIYYRWGYTKMQYVYAATFITLYFVSMAVGRFLPGLPDKIADTSFMQLVTFTLLISVVVIFSLWSGAVKALNKLDLS